MDAQDNHTATSEHSSSHAKVGCPRCDKYLATKAIFTHIRTKHAGYFHQQTTKEWLKEARKNKPLKVFWNMEDDMGEEQTIVLYGCLGSGKTFQYEHKALAHFNKDKQALKEHNEQIGLLLDEREAALEKERKEKEKQNNLTPSQAEYKIMKAESDPDLCAAISWIIDNHMAVCDRLSEDIKHHVPLDLTTSHPDIPRVYQIQTVKESLEMFYKIKDIYSDSKKTSYKQLSNILLHLERFLVLRKFFNGFTAPEVDYPYYASRDHPNGMLSTGESRFVSFLYPWNEGYPRSIFN